MQNLDTLPGEILALIVEIAMRCDALSGYLLLFVNREIAAKLTIQRIAFDGPAMIREAAGLGTADALKQLEWLRSRGPISLCPRKIREVSGAIGQSGPKVFLRQLVATGSRENMKQLLASSRKYRRCLMTMSDVFSLAAILRDFDVLALLQAYRCPTAGALQYARRARRPGNVRWLESRCIE